MDMRIKKTYMNLVEAFEYLLNKNMYEDITVSMLCDKALIRRTTFYKHFTDKDSFYRFYISQKVNELKEVCGANTATLDVWEYRVYMMYTIMTFLMDNETLVNNLFKSSRSATLLDSLADFLTTDVIDKISEKNETAAGSSSIGSPSANAATACSTDNGSPVVGSSSTAEGAADKSPAGESGTNKADKADKAQPYHVCEYVGAAMSGATIQTIRKWWANGHKSEERKRVIEANALIQPQLIIQPKNAASNDNESATNIKPSSTKGDNESATSNKRCDVKESKPANTKSLNAHK